MMTEAHGRSFPRVPASALVRLSVGVLVLALAWPALALAGDEADPLEILKKADAATRAITSASYEAEFFGDGDLADRPRATGSVKLRQGRRGLVGCLMNKDDADASLRLVGKWTEPRARFVRNFDVATDGRRILSFDHADRRCHVASADEGWDLIKGPRCLFMIEFLHPAPFNDEIVGHERRYEGTQDIAGESCHVIYVKYLNNSESRWYFSAQDYLPRRVDRIVNSNGVNGAICLQISGLKTGVSFKSDVFQPDVPRGYRTEAYSAPRELNPIESGSRAPDWTLKTPAGADVKLSDLRGKIVVLQFWSPESYPSLISMPGTQWLSEHFRDKPVQIYALTCFEGDRCAQKCLDEKQLKVPLLLHADDVAREYHVTMTPTTYIICPKGYVITAERGYQYKGEEKIAAIVDRVLNSMPGE